MCVVLHWEKLVKVCSDHPDKLLQFKPRAHKPVQNRKLLNVTDQEIAVQE